LLKILSFYSLSTQGGEGEGRPKKLMTTAISCRWNPWPALAGLEQKKPELLVISNKKPWLERF
jgi:hypothetical protein